MSDFEIYTETTAPEASQETLKTIKSAFGFIPNAMAMLAESNPALSSYLMLDAQVQQTSLTPAEVQVLILAISRENECHYCTAAHSLQAELASLDAEVIARLRAGEFLANSKHQALAEFGRKMVRQRGWLGEQDLQGFLDAGYSKANIFDVILVVAMKTITNYANHITQTPLDNAFADYRWAPDAN